MRPLPGDHSVSIGGLLTNPSFMAALLSCVTAQLLKPLVHKRMNPDKKLDWHWAISPGGMPSSHTAFVTGLTTAVGVLEGTNSTLFALALVLTLVVAYDATGVRLHAGRHASVLNVIVDELRHSQPEHPASDTEVLKETLGHTPEEVAVGAAVGLVVAWVLVSVIGMAGAVPALPTSPVPVAAGL